MKYIISFTPRSGSTWTTNLLNDGNHHCFHDLSIEAHLSKALIFDLLNNRNIDGTCDTGVNIWNIGAPMDTPILYVRRKKEEVISSLYKMKGIIGQDLGAGWEEIVATAGEDNQERLMDERPGDTINFADLFTLESAVKIWELARPGDKFNSNRAWNLIDMNVQPSPAKLIGDMVRVKRSVSA